MIVTAVVVAALALAVPSGAANGQEETRETMDVIFDAMTTLLPLALDERNFDKPEHREEIEAALRTLANSTAELEQHSGQRSEGFRHLSRSLTDDVRALRLHYEDGRLAEARFLLQVMTDTCVACHSRLPTTHEFPFADRLLARVEMQTLSAKQRARLLVATRQFERSLAAYEQILVDPEMPPSQMDLGGHIVDYLTVSIRVFEDYLRPVRHLRALGARTDTSGYLRRHIQGWTRSLEELAARDDLKPDLETARSLLDRGRALSEFPTDRDGLVYHLATSGLLHRFVEMEDPASSARAEAYYLLGVAESRSRPSYWVSQTELYLEAAIRLSPQAPFARKAYSTLEEFTVLGYTGSSGEHVPPDVRARLEELRRLVEEPSPPRDDP